MAKVTKPPSRTLGRSAVTGHMVLRQVAGPRQVPLEEWRRIVRAVTADASAD